MEAYRTTRESIDCDCGGKRSSIPDIVARHNNTYKHTTWRFKCLCCELLTAEDRGKKLPLLREMRDLVRSGRVLDL